EKGPCRSSEVPTREQRRRVRASEIYAVPVFRPGYRRVPPREIFFRGGSTGGGPGKRLLGGQGVRRGGIRGRAKGSWLAAGRRPKRACGPSPTREPVSARTRRRAGLRLPVQRSPCRPGWVRHAGRHSARRCRG